jgi:hypothetical protein
MLDTVAAMVTQLDSMRVMAILAIEVTALQENDEPVARPVNAREG